jgi:hypothetical protein
MSELARVTTRSFGKNDFHDVPLVFRAGSGGRGSGEVLWSRSKLFV